MRLTMIMRGLFDNVSVLPMSQQRVEYGERTAQSIDDEIRRHLAEAHERVRQTLKTNRDKLDLLAKLLEEKEVVDCAALDTLLSPTDARKVEFGSPLAESQAEAQGITT